jgi:hypothetical protein
LEGDLAAQDTRLDDVEADVATLQGAGYVTMATYDSGEITLTASSVSTLAHGLGAQPHLITYWLRCKTTQFGYAVNEEILLAQPVAFGTTNYGHTGLADATNITIQFGNNANMYWVHNRLATIGSPVGITNGNWRLVVRAYRWA